MNYQIPHKREANFYKDNIEKRVELLIRKYKNRKYYFLKDFLFNEISLQELEKTFLMGISQSLLEKA